MLPTASVFRANAALRPVLRTPAQITPNLLRNAAPRQQGLAKQQMMLAQRRWNVEESRGGKSKLVFRFGWKDVPVELYPMAFVVAAALVGATVAMGRHFYLDGLRIAPTGKEGEAH